MKTPKQMLEAVRDPSSRPYLVVATVAILLLGTMALSGGDSSKSRVKTAVKAGAANEPGAAPEESGVVSGTVEGTSSATSASEGTQASSGSSRAQSQQKASSRILASSQSIKVGLPCSDSAVNPLLAFGVIGADPGDTGAQRKAVVAWINSHGGVAGKRLEDVCFTASGGDPNDRYAAEQQACTFYTEDKKVDIVASQGSANFMKCLAGKQTPFVTWAAGNYADRQVMNEYADYFFSPSGINTDRVAKVYIESLVGREFFPPLAKIGLIGDVGAGPHWKRSADSVLKPQLKEHGLELDDEVWMRTEDANAMPSVAFRFQQRGVTHVLFMEADGGAVFFSQAAQGSGYRPRLGITSEQAPSTLAATSPNQAAGSMGVGYIVGWDVENQQHRPPPTPGWQRCKKIMDDAGVQISSGFATTSAASYCDHLILIKEAFEKSAEFTVAGFRRGVEALGDSFLVAVGHTNRFGENRHDGGGHIGHLVWDTRCNCYHYEGSLVPA